MNRYCNTEAIIIRKISVKESDLIVTLLTPTRGKIITIAKGAKKLNSSRLGSLQVGNIIKIHLYTKDNQTWISEAQTIATFLNQPKNLVQFNLLFYFLEIFNYFIAENQVLEGVYSTAKKLITAINQNQFTLYIKNEIELIKILGFGLPADIQTTFDQKDLKSCQSKIKTFLESIIEKPLKSSRLFR